jgi:predicted nuclease of restriction endonuclease-like (RecB) superfamily
MEENIYKLSTLPVTENVSGDIRAILAEARQLTARVVNHTMVTAYWLIGRRIVLEEQANSSKAAYGEEVLQNLSKELTTEFGNGFSYSNLRNMRQFYRTYPDPEKCYTVCSKLSWSHNRLIMRVADADAREWYLREAAEQQWSVRTLERNINSFYYQRRLETPVPVLDDKTSVETVIDVRSFIRDPYVLEFVGLPPLNIRNERNLEQLLVDNMQHFLLELGKGFSFVQRQYRISTETGHFYIDLVFYNYILKCFVLVDLKTTKLSHRDVGQMDMYIRMFDSMKRGADDNPTIGILMCAERDETIVKYSVLNDSQQMFASKYLPYLPTEEELKRELERR